MKKLQIKKIYLNSILNAEKYCIYYFNILNSLLFFSYKKYFPYRPASTSFAMRMLPCFPFYSYFFPFFCLISFFFPLLPFYFIFSLFFPFFPLFFPFFHFFSKNWKIQDPYLGFFLFI